MMISTELPWVGSSVTGAVLAAVVAVVVEAIVMGGALVVAAVVGVVVATALVSEPPSESLPQPATRRAAAAGTTSHLRGFDMMDRVSTGLLDWPAADPATSRGTAHRQDVRQVRQQVAESLEAIRPALQADGGDIFLREGDEDAGVITVTLVGACGTCPASTDTLKAGIERIMKDRVDGVTEVVAV